MGARRDERGAVTIMTALFVVVLVGVSALAVDLGMQRVVRRDMQALADVVALDLARDLDQGKSKQEILNDPAHAFDNHKDQSVARNSTTLGDAPTVTYALGTVDSTGVFHESAPTDVPDAVKVTASSAVQFAFYSGKGGATRTAVATSHPPCAPNVPTCAPNQQAKACFKIGSWAANLNSGNSALLNSLIGGALNTTVLGYSGLSTSTLTFGELAAELNLATVDDLSNASLKVSDWLKVTESILRRHGDTANADLLLGLKNAVLAANVVNKQVQLGAHADASGKPLGLFDLTGGGASGLATSVSALDIVSAAAFLANGSTGVVVPVALNIPGVGTSNVSVTVIQRPSIDCGPVGLQIQTSQVDVTADVAIAPTLPAGMSLTSGSHLTVTLSLAKATGTLTTIVCSNTPTLADPEGIDVKVDVVGATGNVQASVNLSYGGLNVGNLTSALFGVLGTGSDVFHGSGTVTATANLSALSGTVTPNPLTFRSPPSSYATKMSGSYSGPALTAPNQVAVGANMTEIGNLLGALGLGSSNEAKVDAQLVNALQANLVTNFFSGIVTGVNNNLLTTLSDLVGVKVMGADVWAVGRPTCQGAVLVG